MRGRGRAGQSLIEFTLAAIPMIFLMISVEEIARGMWIYVTLTHAVKEGTRYGIVHGADCTQAASSCAVSVGQIATQVKNAGLGLDPSQFSVVLQTAGTTKSCAPLTACLGVGTAWPNAPDNAIGLPLTISATYPFNTLLSMFVPRAGGIRFGSVVFGATSQEEIRY
jgi:hypothetical protein